MAIPDPSVSIRVPRRLLERLDRIADFHGLTRTDVLLMPAHALWTPHGVTHRRVNALRESYDRRRRR